MWLQASEDITKQDQEPRYGSIFKVSYRLASDGLSHAQTALIFITPLHNFPFMTAKTVKTVITAPHGLGGSPPRPMGCASCSLATVLTGKIVLCLVLRASKRSFHTRCNARSCLLDPQGETDHLASLTAIHRLIIPSHRKGKCPQGQLRDLWGS